MMIDNKDDKTLEVAKQTLDQTVDRMPDDLSAALKEARQRALDSDVNDSSTNEHSKVASFALRQNPQRMVWGGAIAASCAALALTLVLRQPASDGLLPIDAADSLAIAEAEAAVEFLAELDETEWDLVQELEFALWLSEFGNEAAAADFSG